MLKRARGAATAARVAALSALANSTVVLLVDSNDHTPAEIDELYYAIRKEHKPVVMLHVVRRFDAPASTSTNIFLPDNLNIQEASQFYQVYKHEQPNREPALRALRQASRRSAFLFGLTAYGKDFKGIPSYVESRLSKATTVQRQVLLFVSLSLLFAQRGMSGQYFASAVGLPQSRRVPLVSIFPAQHGLSDLVIADGEQWRPIHAHVAEEILAQLLGGGSATRWKENLSTAARELIEHIKSSTSVELSEDAADLLRRLFLIRPDVEELATTAQRSFSRLIQVIPAREGRVAVLHFLSNTFPSEAHFRAHYGRLLASLGRHDEALEQLDAAIRAQPHDHVLHHMKGMALRHQVMDRISVHEPPTSIIELVHEASQCFTEARSKDRDSEHAYISDIQLHIRFLDYAKTQSKRESVAEAARLETNENLKVFFETALERCEALLEELRNIRLGDKLSDYETEARAQIDSLYGNHQLALQRWDQLLAGHPSDPAAVRRNIVHTLLQRRNRNWDELTRKEADRCAKLLSDNLLLGETDPASLKLWLHATRFATNQPSLDELLERIGYWRAHTGDPESAFYFYALHALRILLGHSSIAATEFDSAVELCKRLSGLRRLKNMSVEWFGHGNGISALVHRTRLGQRGEAGVWENSSLLKRVDARITRVDGPQKGRIEINGILPAFFVPLIGEFSQAHVNARVTAMVGFTYEGLHAWDVELL